MAATGKIAQSPVPIAYAPHQAFRVALIADHEPETPFVQRDCVIFQACGTAIAPPNTVAATTTIAMGEKSMERSISAYAPYVERDCSPGGLFARYPGPVHVRPDSLDEEVRVTVDAAISIANELALDSSESSSLPEAVRSILIDREFLRAAAASEDELAELIDRCQPIGRLVRNLPDDELAVAVEAVNHQLQACAIAPTLSAHDGYALHIHWTAAHSSFAHQAGVDLLMAIAQTLCDHGVDRFGRCGASGCERVFFDTTKNRSRRFCDDPRCASRTHTAAHRARRSDAADEA